MRLAELVAALHAAFDPAAAMADVAELCRHDRYQAGDGIDSAAGYVAERATGAGLVGVEVLRFPADGMRRWWTFAGPVRWTPRRAWVRIGGTQVLCYPEQAHVLAANSAATPVRRLPVVRWSAAGCPDPSGALVLLEGLALPAVLDQLAGRDAVGVVADPLAGRAGRWPGQVGRIELPAGCPLFAFSATGQQLATLYRGSAAGVPVDVLVDAESSAGTLPVVTGLLPGSGRHSSAGELLLSAHLCHPRPSANDNASGVAALLGLARAGGAVGAGPPVRFVWGPEFVGMAAYLHDVVHAGRAPRPVAAVNIDMAGEDQRRCGGPLVIERAPDELPSPLSAVAERCAALIPPAGRSYSGAVPCDTWTWRATPYVGATDHAILAGSPTGCPAVSLGHWPDAANHTSADTIDLVDPAELRRTATVAGATIAALRGAGHDHELAADVADVAVAWAAGRVLSALPGSRPPAPPPAPGPVFDPWAPEHAARLLAHRAAVARAVLRSVPLMPAGAADWITGLAGMAANVTFGSLEAADVTFGSNRAGQAGGLDQAGGLGHDVLVPRWAGPFNLRYLGECAEPADRRWLADISAADRGGSYARLLALARALDGRRDRTAVAWWAAATSELAVPVAMAQRFLHLLCEVGWAESSSTGGARC